ncbi:MAG: ferrous iron transport protein B [Proteobacteria bacterium]|nr:ferrous iron transport protein B [Pseudomonadota bacterium]MBU1710405.1 ferrous iron transport protein B [Pseudomonadota bacterium]
MNKELRIALAGNPNSGKTTLFNTLTGARQHVGNYPGVTVEKKEGIYQTENARIRVIDLPGTYSLTAYSVEEVVARDFLVNEKPHAVINTTDASNLERNLYLTTQFLEMGVPIIIALNMIDVAKDRGISINSQKLSELLGVPVVPIIARTGQGTKELMEEAARIAETHADMDWHPVTISYGDDLDEVLIELEALIASRNFLTDTYIPRWTAIKYLEDDREVLTKGRKADAEVSELIQTKVKIVADHIFKTIETYPEAMIADHRYGFINSILKQGVLTKKYNIERLYASDRIDMVVTNRFLGPLIMLAVLLGLYKFTFTYSQIPVGWLESFFNWLSNAVDTTLADGQLKSLITSGIIDGVGGVLGFVPLIMFMFFGIAILEDSGYLARVAFMMDRIFRIFGLHGSSVMAYIVSGGIAGGCAVPGVMATRTLRSPRERMATLLTVPFMNCGAKLPVLVLLTGTFFSKNQTRYMFMFTLLAWCVSLLVAKFLRMTVLRGEATPFVMELPPYRFPTFNGLMIHTWERTWQYIRKAGTVILGFSILLWAMMTYPGLPESKNIGFEAQRTTIIAGYSEATSRELTETSKTSLSDPAKELKQKLNTLDRVINEQTLRHSIAGRIGTSLEKVSQFAGFDWRTNIALLGGFAAKEVIISTLGTAYSLGEVDPDAAEPLSKTLAVSPSWNKAVALALIVFIMFYSPCFATVICIVRESSWKWGVFSMVFNTTFAFLFATIVYQLSRITSFFM